MTKQQYSSSVASTKDGRFVCNVSVLFMLGSLVCVVRGCEKHLHLHRQKSSSVSSSTPPLVQIPIYRNLKLSRSDRDEDAHDHTHTRKLPSLLSGIKHTEISRPMVYEGFGTQFMDLYIGTPPQKRTLAVQTSSDYTSIACDTCISKDDNYNHCGKDRDDLYYTTKSQTFEYTHTRDANTVCPRQVWQNYEFTNTQTFHEGKCRVDHQFRDISSYRGYHVVDQTVVADMGASNGFPMKFLCQTRTSGKYTDQVVDGVVSLSPSPNSLISQLKESGKIHHAKFSSCFNARSSFAAAAGNEETGIITLGGYDPLMLKSPMLFTPLVDFVPTAQSPQQVPGYRIIMKRIHLRSGGGQTALTMANQQVSTMELPHGVSGAATIDSEHPYLTFQHELRETFHQLWNQLMEESGMTLDTIPHDLSDDEILRLPTILLEFGEGHQFNSELDPNSVPALTSSHNVLLAIPATHYMEKNGNNKKIRHRIQFGSEGSHRYSIVGANAMQGHTIVFDLENHKIGFGEVDVCREGASSIREQGNTLGATPIEIQTADATMIEDVPLSAQEQQSDVVQPNPNIIISENSGGAVLKPQKAYANIVDDDLFAPLDTTPTGSKSQNRANEQNQKEQLSENIYGGSTQQGSCVTATCRSFLGLGYVIVGTILAVAYRVSRPKELTMPSELLQAAIDAANGYGLPGTKAYTMTNQNKTGGDNGGESASVTRSVEGGGSVGSLSRRSNALQDDATLG
eukprot:CAMPEP_0195293050 /NCGR_PEP_ID=MMETSP0707-20130614/11541_1 /TAXON_ID=33640 /ORGANISM="Asterionellopsis glacialis, Strain CCMP134" /LENGTH=737 /DNA_ID=CAMNT_0040353677 /DNA_START=137 /DNA_END=2346 /DNA_ORIENTATION=-